MHDDPRRLPPIPEGTGVTFVMPVLNEVDYLERAVASVRAQSFGGATELVLALGPSTDGTTELARSLAQGDSRIILVDNPQADIPAGLNRAIRAGSHPVIVRVDAHSELDAGYTARALQTLSRTGAANVGGVMRAAGTNAFQRAVARAYNSPVGLGGGIYHGGDEEGPAESAYLGVMRRAVLDEVGMFDPSIRRGEDWELNLRIRRAGYLVWFDPALSVTYWPRSSWTRLVRQFYATGRWRGELVRRFGRGNSLRFFAPPALVVTIMVSATLTTLSLVGVRSRALTALTVLGAIPVAAYLVLVGAVTASAQGGHGGRDRAWTAAVLPTMHLAWGCGLLVGWVRGARDTVDTSRLGARNTPLP